MFNAVTNWFTNSDSDNEAGLSQAFPVNTSICNDKADCGNTKVTWPEGTEGPIHIVVPYKFGAQ